MTMNTFWGKAVLFSILAWSAMPIYALDASGIAALQQYASGASPQIVSTADQLNEQYVIFENLMRDMNTKLSAVQQSYQTWNDFIESFPSCGTGSLTLDSTGANTCQNTVFPTLQQYITVNGTSSQLSFTPALTELQLLAGKASMILSEISNNTQKIASVMDTATVNKLALNLNTAGQNFNNDFSNLTNCYNAAVSAGGGLDACYALNGRSTSTPVACTLSSNCQGEACCSTDITALVQDYNTLTQAQLAFFEEIQKYFPYSVGEMSSTRFSGLAGNIGSWLLGCAAPNLCNNCGQSSGNVCDFSMPTFNFDFDIYLNAFLQWANTMNNVTMAANNKLSTYQQDLQNFSNDFGKLIAQIQPTATQMGTLMSCCQTAVADYQKVLQDWDLAITMIGGLVIGIGEIDAVAGVVEAIAGSAGDVKALMMVITAIPPVGNALVGSIVNLFSMPFAKWVASAGSVSADRSQVLDEPQITDYGTGYSASQSAQN